MINYIIVLLNHFLNDKKPWILFLAKWGAVFNIVLLSYLVLVGAAQYEIDNARDYLLVHHIVHEDFFTLIGPRSGAIQGIFHGPLWLYLLVIPFVLSQGSPIGMSLFGVFLLAIATGIVYFVGKKMYDDLTGNLAAFLFSSGFSFLALNAFNPFGAVMLFPICFYTFMRYIESKKVYYLVLSYFVLGLIIQFQMAFGIPILLLLIPFTFLLMRTYNHQSYWYYPFIILLPLLTFIVFDIRHGWLQIRSVVHYLATKVYTPSLDSSLVERLYVSLTLYTKVNNMHDLVPFIGIISITLLGYVIYSLLSSNSVDRRNRIIWGLFAYLYVGYWIITLLYPGKMWLFYYHAFLPMIYIVIASAHRYMSDTLFIVVMIPYILLHLYGQFFFVSFEKNEFINKSELSWTFHHNVVNSIFDEIDGDFGYYTIDNTGNGAQGRYAITYLQKDYPDKHAYYNTKMVDTIIYYVPNTITESWDIHWWIRGRLNIKKEPEKHIAYDNGVQVFHYKLSKEEITKPHHHTVTDTLQFR